ncbi:acyl-CoA thioesterase [Actinomarinicola tropica]|uniref:Acyl-CoA thioesterase II n=1 Tax=Actinomarinicola tropica TaxID=2789776 RepID=A0A5Q2RMT8_9ACTN|nr:acyl-CoA thioesterase domain-containing protein [Actinomarinicola tropica]QGG94515.1 acyl-CoA thioesterase II [Actinomarinicola tropica]
MDFLEMMALEPHGTDTYVGTGPAYPWGGLYGGQIVAQALRAAGHTVEDRFLPHSLHAYFIRPGDHTEPIRFEVDRLRNGRSFVTRQVVARQSNGAILTMIASFQTAEESPDVQAVDMPTVAAPDELDDDTWSPFFDRRSVPGPADGQALAWLRVGADLGDDPVLHACALAYASDDIPIEPVRELHPQHTPWTEDGTARPEDTEDGDVRPEDTEHVSSISLDHALWFHRPFRADEWHLEVLEGAGIGSSRGLGRGSFFASDGTHIASVAQEGLVRLRRRPSG